MPFILDRTPMAAQAISGGLQGFLQTREALLAQKRQEAMQERSLGLEEQKFQASVAQAEATRDLQRQLAESQQNLQRELAAQRDRQFGQSIELEKGALDVRRKVADIQSQRLVYDSERAEAEARLARVRALDAEVMMHAGLGLAAGASSSLLGSKGAGLRGAAAAAPLPEEVTNYKSWMPKEEQGVFENLEGASEAETAMMRNRFMAIKWKQNRDREQAERAKLVYSAIGRNPTLPNKMSMLSEGDIKDMNDRLAENDVDGAWAAYEAAASAYEQQAARYAYLDHSLTTVQELLKGMKPDDRNAPVDWLVPLDPDGKPRSLMEGERRPPLKRERMAEIAGTLTRLRDVGYTKDDNVDINALIEEAQAIAAGKDYPQVLEERRKAEEKAAATRQQATMTAMRTGAEALMPMRRPSVLTKEESQRLRKAAVSWEEWTQANDPAPALTQILQATNQFGDRAGKITAARLGLNPGDPGFVSAYNAHVTALRRAREELNKFFRGGGYDAQAEEELNKLNELLGASGPTHKSYPFIPPEER